MNRKVFALGLAIASILASCSSDDSANPTTDCESTIPFLHEGNQLEYAMTQFGFDSGTMKMRFGACNGEGFLVTREMFNPTGDLLSTSVDLMKQDGDFLLVDSGNNGDYFSKNFKKNAALGETWVYTRSDGAVVTHEVIDIDSLITVPAGEFHCKVFKYTSSAAINESHVFWHEELGNIKEDAGFFTMELKSYH